MSATGYEPKTVGGFMLDRQHGKIVFECDDCGAVLETGESDFSDAVSAMRDAGWTSRKIGDVWTHKCEECGS